MAGHILLAEDNHDIIEVMREILEGEGYRVTCARNGAEAYRAFERETPDLIVSDVMMPQMDGFTLLRTVRAHAAGAAVPFLFLSARTEAAATTQARVLGADDYLFKPFDADDLSLAVRAKLARRRAVELFDTRAAHLQTVLMLANVIEARDGNTRGHVERVQRYALELARTLHWSEEALVVLEFGALLHDIGKILVPRHDSQQDRAARAGRMGAAAPPSRRRRAHAGRRGPPAGRHPLRPVPPRALGRLGLPARPGRRRHPH